MLLLCHIGGMASMEGRCAYPGEGVEFSVTNIDGLVKSKFSPPPAGGD